MYKINYFWILLLLCTLGIFVGNTRFTEMGCITEKGRVSNLSKVIKMILFIPSWIQEMDIVMIIMNVIGEIFFIYLIVIKLVLTETEFAQKIIAILKISFLSFLHIYSLFLY